MWPCGHVAMACHASLQGRCTCRPTAPGAPQVPPWAPLHPQSNAPLPRLRTVIEPPLQVPPLDAAAATAHALCYDVLPWGALSFKASHGPLPTSGTLEMTLHHSGDISSATGLLAVQLESKEGGQHTVSEPTPFATAAAAPEAAGSTTAVVRIALAELSGSSGLTQWEQVTVGRCLAQQAAAGGGGAACPDTSTESVRLCVVGMQWRA